MSFCEIERHYNERPAFSTPDDSIIGGEAMNERDLQNSEPDEPIQPEPFPDLPDLPGDPDPYPVTDPIPKPEPPPETDPNPIPGPPEQIPEFPPPIV